MLLAFFLPALPRRYVFSDNHTGMAGFDYTVTRYVTYTVGFDCTVTRHVTYTICNSNCSARAPNLSLDIFLRARVSEPRILVSPWHLQRRATSHDSKNPRRKTTTLHTKRIPMTSVLGRGSWRTTGAADPSAQARTIGSVHCRNWYFSPASGMLLLSITAYPVPPTPAMRR